jgi:hypothetical protein
MKIIFIISLLLNSLANAKMVDMSCFESRHGDFMFTISHIAEDKYRVDWLSEVDAPGATYSKETFQVSGIMSPVNVELWYDNDQGEGEKFFDGNMTGGFARSYKFNCDHGEDK